MFQYPVAQPKKSPVMGGQDKITKAKALIVQNGGWRGIFSRYPGLSVAISKADSGNARNPGAVPCPLSGQGRTKFRLFGDWEQTGGGYHNDEGALSDGLSVLEFMEGSISKALDAVIDYYGGHEVKFDQSYIDKVKALEAKAKENREITAEESNKRLAKIEKVFQYTKAASTQHPIASYLIGRGLKGDMNLLPDALGYNPVLWWGDGEGEAKKLSGMLAIMSDVSGKAITLHRTFLDPNTHAKASVENSKLVMSPPKPLNGLSIKLDKPIPFGDGYILGLCEGIETALACREATGIPMWACYNNFLLEQVELPKEVTTVIIYGDKDVSQAGQKSTKVLAERLRKDGIEVYEELPAGEIPEGEKSIDWLDVYVNEGLDAFNYFMEGLDAVKTGVDYLQEPAGNAA